MIYSFINQKVSIIRPPPFRSIERNVEEIPKIGSNFIWRKSLFSATPPKTRSISIPSIIYFFYPSQTNRLIRVPLAWCWYRTIRPRPSSSCSLLRQIDVFKCYSNEFCDVEVRYSGEHQWTTRPSSLIPKLGIYCGRQGAIFLAGPESVRSVSIDFL